MKKLMMVMMFVLAIGSLAGANESLKQTMENMKRRLNTISKQADDSSQNENSKKLASELSKLIAASLQEVPDTVKELPAEQQKSAQAQYQEMISDTLTLSQQLEAAFASNDNQLAKNILENLKVAKKEGHDQFKH